MDFAGHIIRETIVIVCTEHRDYSCRILFKQHFNAPVSIAVRIDPMGNFVKLTTSDGLCDPIVVAIFGQAFRCRHQHFISNPQNRTFVGYN